MIAIANPEVDEAAPFTKLHVTPLLAESLHREEAPR